MLSSIKSLTICAISAITSCGSDEQELVMNGRDQIILMKQNYFCSGSVPKLNPSQHGVWNTRNSASGSINLIWASQLSAETKNGASSILCQQVMQCSKYILICIWKRWFFFEDFKSKLAHNIRTYVRLKNARSKNTYELPLMQRRNWPMELKCSNPCWDSHNVVIIKLFEIILFIVDNQ